MSETLQHQHNEDELYKNAAQRLLAGSEPPRPLHITERGKNFLVGAGATLGVVAGATGLVSAEGGTDNPDRGELKPNIEITLSEDARLRNDPSVSNNLVYETTQSVTVNTEDEVRVLNNTDNGTWYGVNKEDIAAAIPSFDGDNDKDGIVWVNEATASIAEKDAPQTTASNE